jgi:hypothetical protein
MDSEQPEMQEDGKFNILRGPLPIVKVPSYRRLSERAKTIMQTDDPLTSALDIVAYCGSGETAMVTDDFHSQLMAMHDPYKLDKPIDDFVFGQVEQMGGNALNADKIFQSLERLDGTLFSTAYTMVTQHAQDVVAKAGTMSCVSKQTFMENMISQMTKFPNKVVKVEFGTELVPGHQGIACRSTPVDPKEMHMWQTSMFSGNVSGPNTAYWPSNLYTCIEMIYLLFVGCGCHVPFDHVTPHFAELQKVYTNVLAAAVVMMGRPLDGNFICMDISKTLLRKFMGVSSIVRNSRNRGQTLSVINSALVESMKFVMAHRIHSVETAKMAMMDYKKTRQEVERFKQMAEEESDAAYKAHEFVAAFKPAD